jgi:hypothetical protein
MGMVCTTISRAWARQRERRDAEASRATDNAAQALYIVALRVVARKPRARQRADRDAGASLRRGNAALGFLATMQTIPITETGS